MNQYENPTLDTATAESRQALAQRLDAIAQTHGAVVRTEVRSDDCLFVCIEGAGGLRMSFELTAHSAKSTQVNITWNVDAPVFLSHEAFCGSVDVANGALSAHRWCRGEEELGKTVSQSMRQAADGSAYGTAGQPLCYIINLSHLKRSDKYITVWRPNNSGYAWPLSWAGRYALNKVQANLSYYCSGPNIAVPCEVLDRMAVEPEKGYIDNNAGPVVPNCAESWKAIHAALIAPALHPMVPVYPGARGRKPFAYDLRRAA